VDSDLDVAYGFRKVDGRQALIAKTLDGTGTETVVFAHPQVDVDGLVRIGRRGRVVGASYVTDARQRTIFDPTYATLLRSLSKALPNAPAISIRDASMDERRLLVFAGSDTDAGTYYLFDRDAKKLTPFIAVREPLDGRQLAAMKPITYAARDGVAVPAYLSLPPGKTSLAGLPALVLPHGGPSARDEWGFDWLAQYWAARGYAVIQPNFRGSAGYGDAWFQQNGFKSWRTAVGDVADAGRYLLAQGADPKRLAIFGWSYGGYAALQAAAVEPDLFRAVVAVAPVTDLDRLKEDRRYWSDYRNTLKFVGSGPHTRDGSPAQRAAEIKAPVLIVHGDMDLNVNVGQARLMAAKLDAAKVPNKLMIMRGLDHYLDDSEARATMLREADGFLKASMP
jgi:dipeptidyl aminopeptidase/acylaminoacyl peptidase